MITGMTILIAIIGVLLMLVILIQNPKGGGIDSTMGGAQANQIFGASNQTNLIDKITWGLAIALFVLCIVTSIMAGGDIGTDGQIPLKTQ